MAYKFEIKSNAVVVTDTTTSEVLIAQPAKNTWFEESRLDIGSVSLYGMSGTDQDNINRYKYDGSKGFPLNECQDGAGATFSANSFRNWCYANLAFSGGGGNGQQGVTTDELFDVERDGDGEIVKTISKYDFQVPPQSIEIGESIKISDLAQEPTYTTKFDAKQYLMMGYEFGEQGSTMPSVKVFGESTSFDLQPLDDVTQTFNTPVLFTITSQQDVIGETYTLKLNASSDVRLEVFREAENGGQEAKLVDEIIPQAGLSLDGVSFKLNPIVDFVSGKLYTLKFTATSGQIDVKGTELAVGGTYGISKAENTEFFPYIRRERGYVYESKELALSQDYALTKSATPPSDTDKIWFNTNDNMSYFYDTDAWVSEQLFSVDFNDQGSTPNNTFLRVGNTVCNDVGVGYNMPFEARIKGLSYSRTPSTAKMGNFWMYSNAITSPSSVVLTFTLDSSERGFIESPVKTDIPATRYISFRWNGNQTNNNILTLQYRKKHV